MTEDVGVAALLDQLGVIDAQAEELEGWKAWRIPLSSLLVLISMSMMGLTYRDPLGLVLYLSLVAGLTVGFVLRRRLLRSLARRREQIIAKHEQVLRLAELHHDVVRDGIPSEKD